jgi:hypothetical protein
MKLVYLVQFEELEDMEKICDSIKAFEKEEDAKAYFNDAVESLKENPNYDLSEWEVDESDNEFCAYPDGEYLDSHLLVTIKAIPLN